MPLPNDAPYFNALKAVQEKYVFRSDPAEILQFIKQYPSLVPVLVEAHRNLMKYFPDNPEVSLRIDIDPEELSVDQLVASVATDLNPEAATDALGAFDENWWVHSLKWTQGKLCITLE